MLRYLDVQNILDKNDLILQESGCVGSENERGNTYMKKIGIVTDSHSSISQEEAEKLGIFVLLCVMAGVWVLSTRIWRIEIKGNSSLG